MRALRASLFIIILAAIACGVSAGNIAIETNLLTPYPGIQAAIDAASNGDVIRIEADTYSGILITSNKNLTFRGGYDATLQTDLGGYTAVDGLSGGSAWTFWNSSSHVEQINIVNGNAIWGGGVLLKNGTWLEFQDSCLCSNISTWGGGGLYIDEFSYAKMTGNSTIFSNMVINIGWPVGVGAYGGGAFVQGRLDIVSDDADIFDNVAVDGYGGGIWLQAGHLRLLQGDVYGNRTKTNGLVPLTYGGGIGATESFLEIGDGAEIYENLADGYTGIGTTHGGGGGIALNLSTALLGRTWADDVTIANNTAENGGGLYATNSVIESRGMVLSGNHALANGGGICLHNSSMDSSSNRIVFIDNKAEGNGGGLQMDNSTFEAVAALFGMGGSGNTANGIGGGALAYMSEMSVYGGTFIENEATNTALSSGGGLVAIISRLVLTNGPGYGGMYTDILFEANSAPMTGTGTVGGGMLLQSSTSFIHFVRSSSNSAYLGGAVYAEDSKTFIGYSRVSGNRAGYNGGGLYVDGRDIDLYDSMLNQNQALNDGGGCYFYNAFGRIYDAEISENIAGGDGGGVYSYFGTLYIYTVKTPAYSVTNGWGMLIQNNTASNTAGGLFIDDASQAIVLRCAIISNSAPAYTSGLMLSGPRLRMQDVLFADNYNSGAGDLALGVDATAIVDRCTFYSTGTPPSLRLYDRSSLDVSNSIMWGVNIWTDGTPNVSINYTDIEGGWPGTDNLDQEPSLYDNRHLRYDSPCINAGAPAPVGEYDVDQEARTGRIDMGMDEFADSDGDNLPDTVETGTGIYVSDINMGSNPYSDQSDIDKVSDFDEWIADTNPNDPNSYLHMTRVWWDGATGMNAEWTGGENADQILEYSTNLVAGSWQTNMTYSPPTPLTNSHTVYYGDEPYHYRIRAHR